MYCQKCPGLPRMLKTLVLSRSIWIEVLNFFNCACLKKTLQIHIRNSTLPNRSAKGQLISKANCQAVNSYKKRTNKFVFTTMRRVFVRFLEEIEVTKKAFRNQLTFIK